jgi:hypothetical protein
VHVNEFVGGEIFAFGSECGSLMCWGECVIVIASINCCGACVCALNAM